PVPDGRGQRTCSGTGRVQRARDPRARDRTRAPAEGTALALSAMANAYVPGLQGVVAARTRLSMVDGKNGVLVIAGFPLEEIAERATFEELVYLLWNDRLPNGRELADFRAQLAGLREIPPITRDVLEAAAERREGARARHVLQHRHRPRPQRVDLRGARHRLDRIRRHLGRWRRDRRVEGPAPRRCPGAGPRDGLRDRRGVECRALH